jgi:ubiquinone/menaquinone biosynthesis C-methylase UbiE
MEASMVEQPDAGQHLHDMWSAVAGSWATHADYVDTRAAELTEAMLELAALRPGDRVLELACGPGGLGLAAARRVAPGGHIVLSDVAPQMTAIAAQRAEARALDNVSVRELDLERIDQPDGSFDIVLCREGLMFALDPARAVREIRRVLRPGGRFAISVWGPRERNPWLAIVLDAVSAQVGFPVPPPGIPGPFALDDANRVAGLFADAPFDDVAVSEFPTPLLVESFETWWTRTLSLAGPLTTMLAALPDDAVGAIRARSAEAARPYTTSSGTTSSGTTSSGTTSSGLEFPGVNLLASGRRATT